VEHGTSPTAKLERKQTHNLTNMKKELLKNWERLFRAVSLPSGRGISTTRFICEDFYLLNKREKRVLTMRFGLEDSVTHTLEQVGRELYVTRERVRQIEAKALDRLRQEGGPKSPRITSWPPTDY
jgi:hypothetical protein